MGSSAKRHVNFGRMCIAPYWITIRSFERNATKANISLKKVGYVGQAKGTPIPPMLLVVCESARQRRKHQKDRAIEDTYKKSTLDW